MTRLDIAIRQIEAARRDTKGFVKDVNEAEWFRQPFEGANHIAWQVGHLAIAEYGLIAGEVLGLTFDEVDWISADFRALFKRGSTPISDGTAYPSPAELRVMLDHIHDHVMGLLAGLPDERLDEAPTFGHPLAETKLEAMHLCARHEALHAGQIAMLRRAFGMPPIR